MADTSTKSVSEFDPGMLVSNVRHLQEDVREIKGRLASMENRMTSMDERQQSNFRWMIGLIVVGVAAPLYLAIFGMLAGLLGLA